MPATVMTDPLAVRCVFPNGTSCTVEFAGLPNPGLAADLALGLSRCVHPDGQVTAKSTVRRYAWSLRQMVRKLSAEGFEGGAADLRRHHVAKLLLAETWIVEISVRGMLRGFDDATGALEEALRDFLTGPNLNVRAKGGPYRAYTEGEWTRLIERCESVAREAEQAQKRIRRVAATGSVPAPGGRPKDLSEADLACLLIERGPMTRLELARYLGFQASDVPEAYASLSREVKAALFPTTEIGFAFRTLFGTYTGIVPDGIDGLDTSDLTWAGDAEILLTYIKGRTGPEGLNLPKRAVRLLERWLEYSSYMRVFASEELRDHLWLISRGPGRGGSGKVAKLGRRPQYGQVWVARQGLMGDDGEPLQIHRSRIRATYQGLLASRGWTGRTTIDPNHTAQVEGDHYLTATTPAQMDAVEAIIEDGQADVLRKAQPPVVLSSERAAELAEQFPDVIAELGLTDVAVAELVGGERDVFTAACADQLAGQYGPAGQPCPARPWVCLLCPLAVFLPRHAENLSRLRAFFARQFRQMPTAQYMAVFGPYAERLDEVLSRFSDQRRQEAALAVADNDSELPLRPEETT